MAFYKQIAILVRLLPVIQRKRCNYFSKREELECNMKRLLLGLLVLAVFFSCSNAILDPSQDSSTLNQSPELALNLAALDDDPIQVLTIEDIARGHYGIPSRSVRFLLRVKNLGYDKSITVYGELSDGSWDDLSNSATYIGSADPGFELWTVTAAWNAYYGTPSFGDEFTIRYEVNGETYWANNDGVNYQSESHSGYQLTDDAGNVRLSSAYHYSYNNSVSISAVLKNIAYDKVVKVRYSYDNWNSYSESELSHSPYWGYSYTSPVPSPNTHGIELWNTTFSLPAGIAPEDVKFAISYEVNGEKYWDNNFEQDYSLPSNF
jgi:hypothetical protein